MTKLSSSKYTQCSADAWIVALFWKVPQMPSCSANSANLDNFLKTCFTNLQIESRIIMLSWTEICLSFVIFLFSILKNLDSNPDPLFLCRLNECLWRQIAIQIMYVRVSVRPSVRPLKFRLTFFKLLMFEQVRVNYNQTWIIGALWETSHYDALGGHMSRSKV